MTVVSPLSLSKLCGVTPKWFFTIVACMNFTYVSTCCFFWYFGCFPALLFCTAADCAWVSGLLPPPCEEWNLPPPPDAGYYYWGGKDT